MNMRFQTLCKSLLILSSLLVLSACSIFGGKKEIDLEKPAELQEFEASYEIDRVWRRNLGRGAGKQDPIATPAIDGDTLFFVDSKGLISAIDLRTGDSLWKEQIKGKVITGSTGAANGLIVAGTREGEVVALSQEDGRLLWTAKLSTEVVAAPATNGEIVVVNTIDGQIFALDAADGSEKWLVDTSVPLLTLRGRSSPVIVPQMRMPNGATIDMVFVGHDNGKISAYTATDGVQVWEARVGIPEGGTDLERIVDIDGTPIFLNGSIYAVSYQGGVISVQPDTGRTNWYQEASSVNSPAGYGGTLVVTEDNGRVRAFNSLEGTELWSSDEYANRQLNTAIVTNDYAAFADFKGYLHFLSRRGGETVARIKASGQGIRSATLLHNNQILVLDNEGVLSSYGVLPAR